MNAPRSINLNVWWWVIFVSSSVVAAYAVAMCIVPAMRSTFVADIVDVRPVAAFSHFLGSSVALIAGTLQINRVIRVNRPVLHRWLGRIYLVGIAFGASSGLAMSVEASGGMAGPRRLRPASSMLDHILHPRLRKCACNGFPGASKVDGEKFCAHVWSRYFKNLPAVVSRNGIAV